MYLTPIITTINNDILSNSLESMIANAGCVQKTTLCVPNTHLPSVVFLIMVFVGHVFHPAMGNLVSHTADTN